MPTPNTFTVWRDSDGNWSCRYEGFPDARGRNGIEATRNMLEFLENRRFSFDANFRAQVLSDPDFRIDPRQAAGPHHTTSYTPAPVPRVEHPHAPEEPPQPAPAPGTARMADPRPGDQTPQGTVHITSGRHPTEEFPVGNYATGDVPEAETMDDAAARKATEERDSETRDKAEQGEAPKTHADLEKQPVA